MLWTVVVCSGLLACGSVSYDLEVLGGSRVALMATADPPVDLAVIQVGLAWTPGHRLSPRANPGEFPEEHPWNADGLSDGDALWVDLTWFGGIPVGEAPVTLTVFEWIWRSSLEVHTVSGPPPGYPWTWGTLASEGTCPLVQLWDGVISSVQLPEPSVIVLLAAPLLLRRSRRWNP